MAFSTSNQVLPRYLTQEEVTRLFAVISDPRDRALFTVIYLYGLRVSEPSLLLRSDVDLEHRRITIKHRKGGDWSERPLFQSAADALSAYFSAVYLLPDAPLFPGRGGGLQRRRIQELFVQYRTAAGLPAQIGFKRIGSHTLRHSIATHMLDAEMSIYFVMSHLGHRDIRSTMVYAKLSSHHIAAVFDRLEASPWIAFPKNAAGDHHESKKEA